MKSFMNTQKFLIFLVLILQPLALITSGYAEQTKQAELKISGVFSHNAVLQRNMPLPVWGSATPGSKITVSFANQTKNCITNKNGEWRVILDAQEASKVPQTLLVNSSESKELRIDNILVGDVWLCSGQSNMVLSIGYCVRSHPKLRQRLEKVDNKFLRLGIKAKSNYGENKHNDDFTWKSADPTTAKSFSAIGFLFGVQIQREVDVPVGIIQSAVGGSYIEQWLPNEKLTELPACEAFVKKYKKAVIEYPQVLGEFNKLYPTKEALISENKTRQLKGEKKLKVPVDPKIWKVPSQLFDGMIDPLVSYPLKGVLWYQGEGNVWQFSSYDKMMIGLIQSWRKLWNQPDLPFIMTELAPFNKHQAIPHDSARSRFGETLAKAATIAGNAWTITITDGGEQADIHPRYKEIPADRFAAMALAKVYGKNTICHGPVLKSWQAVEGKAILTFSSTGKGLEAKTVVLDNYKLSANQIVGFELADAKRRFYPAKAEIRDGNTIVLSHPEVKTPIAVRYAWGNFPLSNLYNKEGFSTYPFRTDDWPWKTPK